MKIKIILRSFIKSSEHINETRDGSYRGFGYLSRFNDPLDLAGAKENNCNFATFYTVVVTKTSKVHNRPKIILNVV